MAKTIQELKDNVTATVADGGLGGIVLALPNTIVNDGDEVVAYAQQIKDLETGKDVSSALADIETEIGSLSGDVKVDSTYETTKYSDPFNDKVSAAVIGKTTEGTDITDAHVAADDTITVGFKKVETTISTAVDDILKNEIVVAEAVNGLAEATGTINSEGGIAYNTETNANYISTATSVHNATVILDSQLKSIADSQIQLNSDSDPLLSLTNSKLKSEIAIVYDSTAKTITLKGKGGKQIGEAIDTSDFIKDGMVSNVALSDDGTQLTITFNTDAGHEDIVIDVANLNVSIPSTYATTEYSEPFDTKVSTGKDGSGDAHVIKSDKVGTAIKKVETTISILADEVIDNEEVIAAAINEIASAAGLVNSEGGIAYNADADATYINVATSLHNATVILDSKINELASIDVIDAGTY